MSAPLSPTTLTRLETEAINEIKVNGSVTFPCGIMDGRLYYQDKEVMLGFENRVRRAAEIIGIRVYKKCEFSEKYDLSKITLTTTL